MWISVSKLTLPYYKSVIFIYILSFYIIIEKIKKERETDVKLLLRFLSKKFTRDNKDENRRD